MKPKHRIKFNIQDLGDEVLIYDDERECVHVMNHTAHTIWNMCNGEHTPEDITAKLQELFPDIDGQQLREDVDTTINDFLKKKILIE